MATNQEKLRTLLAELFQLDQADLDFGIYRIMNQKREEILRFLDNDLLPQVQQLLGAQQSGDALLVQNDLDQRVKALVALKLDPENDEEVKQLRAKLAQSGDKAALENEVFSDLFNFFRRYYDKGDFLSLRRYKEGVYAIPYEGEEVKLHWANADQYYVKSAENFRDYTWKLGDGRRVHFKLANADTEQNNNKAAGDKERRFILAEGDFGSEENGELILRFEYRPDVSNRKQTALNEAAATRILQSETINSWRGGLSAPSPTAKNAGRTVLEKHLADYTARNTFDYFIHKDLGRFLRRELDFYIKNEVMHLDDIEDENAPRVEQYLGKIKVLRRIAHKIIAFLEQLENFQKRLWLKKKFVVETNYCVTLDKVPPELHEAIAKNDAQWQEWEKLFALSQIKPDLFKKAASKTRTLQFLQENPFLVLDTRFFDAAFTQKLLASFDDLDAQTDGLLIHSENFQALNLLQQRYREQVKCVYIDPPYNTGPSEIAYKNNYKHSSWLALMQDRSLLMRELLYAQGVWITAIDENEQERLGLLLQDLFPEYQLTCVTVVHNPSGQQSENFSYSHEYSYFVYPRGKRYIGMEERTDTADVRNFRDVTGEDSLRISAANCFYPILVKDGEIIGFGEVCESSFHPKGINITKSKGITTYRTV